MTLGAPKHETADDYLMGTDTVAPRALYSERELVKAFDELLLTLSNKDHDFWQKRCDALRSIRALVLGGAGDYACFMSCLSSLKNPFADAIADLRSTLVREACVTVALLSQTFGNSFAHIAETLIPAILKQIPVTIQVISEASNLSLRALLRHTHSPRLLTVILQSATGKNKAPIVRARCIEYILVVLELWTRQDLEKHADKIDEVIIQCLADAQPDVRAGARRCVAELCQTYQTRGDRILRGLDAQTQKKIFEESERGAPRPTRPRSSLKPPSLSATGAATNGGGSASTTPSLGVGGGGYLGAKAPASRGEGVGNLGAPQTKNERPEQQAAMALGAAQRNSRAKGLSGGELDNLKNKVLKKLIPPASEDKTAPEKAKSTARGPQRVLAAAAADVEMLGGGGLSPRARRGPVRSAISSDEQLYVAEGKGRLCEDDLLDLLTKCSNNLWSLRESSLLELCAQVDLTPLSRAMLSQVSVCLSVCLSNCLSV